MYSIIYGARKGSFRIMKGEKMKKLLILTAGVLLAAACMKLPEVPTLGTVEIPVAAEEEAVWTSTDYEGKPVLIMYMGSWCPYCKMSMPALNAVAEKYADKAEIVGAFMDADPKVVLDAAKQNDLKVKTLYNAQQAAQIMEVTGLPHAVLFDKKHRAVRVWEGFSPTLAQEFDDQLYRLTK